MPTVNKKAPNPIDVHAGARVRMARTIAGVSQEKLGEALGITFQQIQKYEKGTNRMGSSRLAAIAAALNLPITFFFAEVPAVTESEPSPLALFETQDGAALAKAFAAIQSPRLRRVVVQIARNLAEVDDAGAGGAKITVNIPSSETERQITEGLKRMRASVTP